MSDENREAKCELCRGLGYYDSIIIRTVCPDCGGTGKAPRSHARDSLAPAARSAWPCLTCAAVDWCDAGDKCTGGYTCGADEERMRDYQREQATQIGDSTKDPLA